MSSANLKTAKYLSQTDEDRRYDRQVDRTRRQERLSGGEGELKKVLLTIAICVVALMGFSACSGSKQNLIYSGAKTMEAFVSAAGELNQEKKIWDHVDN